MAQPSLSPDSTLTQAELDVRMDRIRRRKRSENRFRNLGLAAVLMTAGMLMLLLGSVIIKGYTGFFGHQILVTVEIDADEINAEKTGAELAKVNFAGLLSDALRKEFPDVKKRRDRKALRNLLSTGAQDILRERYVNYDKELGAWVTSNLEESGTTIDLWLPADDDIDLFLKGYISRDVPEKRRRVKDNAIGWVDSLEERGKIRRVFAWSFLFGTDSNEPELAGLGGAIKGSAYALLVCFLIAFPIGVAAALYLEEFAPRNRFTDLIEVNINNLAAVPSIIFGLLGLAIFLNYFNLPRSAPLVGGMVLSLLTLPTIIIASRAAIAAVPFGIREAGYGLGASKLQTMVHHVLPLALPGIMTGTIIGLAGALGESAPLLLIGMNAFVSEMPTWISDPSAALPTQIFNWFARSERLFESKSNAAIMLLLLFLVFMNGMAALVRRYAERSKA